MLFCQFITFCQISHARWSLKIGLHRERVCFDNLNEMFQFYCFSSVFVSNCLSVCVTKTCQFVLNQKEALVWIQIKQIIKYTIWNNFKQDFDSIIHEVFDQSSTLKPLSSEAAKQRGKSAVCPVPPPHSSTLAAVVEWFSGTILVSCFQINICSGGCTLCMQIVITSNSNRYLLRIHAPSVSRKRKEIRIKPHLSLIIVASRGGGITEISGTVSWEVELLFTCTNHQGRTKHHVCFIQKYNWNFIVSLLSLQDSGFPNKALKSSSPQRSSSKRDRDLKCLEFSFCFPRIWQLKHADTSFSC